MIRTHKQFPDSPVRFEFTRRRYGSTTYTWAVAILENGQRLDLGDPYPAVNWPKKALFEALEYGKPIGNTEPAVNPFSSQR